MKREDYLRERARAVALYRDEQSEQLISDFQSESVDELAKLFDALMEKFQMSASVVTDELFLCLLCCSHTREVDPASLENEPLAKALRAHGREMEPAE